ncbi:unnamed protein product [Prorocentrum cordatum]|uniref:Uncharacterized protein n=1 Tax=Prorocentrum cordatum TaxID=2364126 RepID=A0ABN9W1F4_9DINO|nr:unnamed protein product [Polarella glacialis]
MQASMFPISRGPSRASYNSSDIHSRVSAAAGRIAERWSGGKAKEQADCSQNGASRRAAQQLRRLCARLRPGGQLEAGGEGAGPEAPGLEELAARRRQRLREGLVDLQVDANGFVAAATDALRQCVKARRSSMCARVRRVVPAAEAVGEKSPARAAAAGPAEAPGGRFGDLHVELFGHAEVERLIDGVLAAAAGEMLKKNIQCTPDGKEVIESEIKVEALKPQYFDISSDLASEDEVDVTEEVESQPGEMLRKNITCTPDGKDSFFGKAAVKASGSRREPPALSLSPWACSSQRPAGGPECPGRGRIRPSDVAPPRASGETGRDLAELDDPSSAAADVAEHVAEAAAAGAACAGAPSCPAAVYDDSKVLEAAAAGEADGFKKQSFEEQEDGFKKQSIEEQKGLDVQGAEARIQEQDVEERSEEQHSLEEQGLRKIPPFPTLGEEAKDEVKLEGADWGIGDSRVTSWADQLEEQLAMEVVPVQLDVAKDMGKVFQANLAAYERREAALAASVAAGRLLEDELLEVPVADAELGTPQLSHKRGRHEGYARAQAPAPPLGKCSIGGAGIGGQGPSQCAGSSERVQVTTEALMAELNGKGDFDLDEMMVRFEHVFHQVGGWSSAQSKLLVQKLFLDDLLAENGEGLKLRRVFFRHDELVRDAAYAMVFVAIQGRHQGDLI